VVFGHGTKIVLVGAAAAAAAISTYHISTDHWVQTAVAAAVLTSAHVLPATEGLLGS
jgi:hypothetical protein